MNEQALLLFILCIWMVRSEDLGISTVHNCYQDMHLGLFSYTPEYMGFVLTAFPLKCGFIIIQVTLYVSVAFILASWERGLAFTYYYYSCMVPLILCATDIIHRLT
jgi:hypothetical protein